MNTVLVPVVAGVVGLLVWYVQSRVEAIRRANESLQDTRRQLYMGVLEPYIKVLAGVTNPKVTAAALKQMGSYEYKRTAVEFSLIGSDSVVRSFNDMMQFIYQSGPDEQSTEVLHLWGGLLLEIRRSLGDPKSALTDKDMLRSFITDIDEIA